MIKMLDFSLEINDFEFKSHYYVYFGTKTFGKVIAPLYLPSYRLNSIASVLLQGWFWQ